MSQFTEPVEKLFQDSKEYLDQQLESAKLRTVKGLSQGTSALGRLLLFFTIAGNLVLMLSFALVLWLGEVMGSYALAGFVVAGVLLVLLVVLYVFRNRLFRNSFVSLYSDVIMPGRQETSLEKLDQAIENAEIQVREQEMTIKNQFAHIQDYYTPSHILNRGLGLLGGGKPEKSSGSRFPWKGVLPVVLRLVFRRKRKR